LNVSWGNRRAWRQADNKTLGRAWRNVYRSIRTTNKLVGEGIGGLETKSDGIGVIKETPQLVAVNEPELTMVAKAVADVPTRTERLDGRTAATIDCAQLKEGANNKMLHVTIIVW